MPPANGKVWRHCRAKMDITSDQAASLLGIKGGSLRQIETGEKPASLALAYRAERLYGVTVDDLLVAESDPQKRPRPTEPQPKVEPVGPPRRKNGKDDKRGPKRFNGEAA